MVRTDNYRRQHQELLALAQEVSAQLSPASIKQNATELRLTLSKLAGKLKIHLVQEDESLYPSLLKSSNAATTATAKRFIDDMGKIADAFTQYYNKWQTQVLKDDPEGFIRETKGIFSALGGRIDKENKELYPLADQLAA